MFNNELGTKNRPLRPHFFLCGLLPLEEGQARNTRRHEEVLATSVNRAYIMARMIEIQEGFPEIENLHIVEGRKG